MRTLGYTVTVQNNNPNLQVLYEDNHLLGVFKPHRLLIQSDHSGSLTLFLQVCHWLKEKYSKSGNVYLGLLHRLDRPAAGVVLFGKTSKGASRLSEQIRERKVEKRYQLIVEGVPPQKQGTCEHYLFPGENQRMQVEETDSGRGKVAKLTYRCLETKGNLSLLEVHLITGRRHQIRAQLAYLGCPILGDGRYGATQSFLPGSIALVASQLSFDHPISQERKMIEIPFELNSVRKFWNED